MIPVAKATKPSTFDKQVKEPGLRALAEMAGLPSPYPRTSGRPFTKIANRRANIPSKDFPPYWTKALEDLMTAYSEICAYSCFRIHRVTGARSADHFIAKSANWRKAYEWSNYRLCCSLLNSQKHHFEDVLDPFVLGKHWFVLELHFFQIVPGDRLNPQVHQQVEDTIKRLGLNDFSAQRQEAAEMYLDGDCSLKILKREAPFVAYELHRQGRLKPGDVW